MFMLMLQYANANIYLFYKGVLMQPLPKQKTYVI